MPINTHAVVKSMGENDSITYRLMDLGITKGAIITPIFRSPFGEPTAYSIQDTVVALRKSDCENILVTPIHE